MRVRQEPSMPYPISDGHEVRSRYRWLIIELFFPHPSCYLRRVTFAPAPSTFEDLIQFIPPRGSISKYRFVTANKSFDLRIGRNSMNVVFLSSCAPDDKTTFWPCVRTVESLTSQRAMWSHWQKFLEDPETYLTWKYISSSSVA